MNLQGLFFGTGKTYHISIISLVLNLCVIFPFFIMINSYILPQAFDLIMLMIVFVDLIDIIIHSILEKKLLNHLKNEEICHQYNDNLELFNRNMGNLYNSNSNNCIIKCLKF